MDVGKVVPNHYKSGFCFLYPYFFYLLLLIEKNLEKTNSPPLLIRLLSHGELSIIIIYQFIFIEITLNPYKHVNFYY